MAAERKPGFGIVGRFVVCGLALAAVTGTLDVAFSLSQPALAGRSDGRYAVDVGRTLALYAALGVGFAVAAIVVHRLFLAALTFVVSGITRARRGARASDEPVSATAPHAVPGLVGVWTYVALVAVRSVHGTWLLGAPDAPGALFHIGAAVFALAMAQVVSRRAAQWRALTASRRRIRHACLAAAVGAGLFGVAVLRAQLDLESLVAREIAALPVTPVAATPRERPDILLLTIDTLRADRVGVYGHGAAETPALDRLAREGVLFERAVAQSSWTRPSFGTIFTARDPSDHQATWRLRAQPGARRSLYNKPLRADLPTLAELLDTAGYLTVAINTNVQTSRPFGFDHGFDAFVDVSRSLSALTSSLPCRFAPLRLAALCTRFSVVSADYPYLMADQVFEIFSSVASRLDATAAPYFLWLHFMDPHVPYRAHDGSGEKIGYGDIESLIADGSDLSAAAARIGFFYDRAITYVDGYVTRVLDRLADTKRAAPPLVLLTSDHGEELLERWRAKSERPPNLDAYHRGYGHGHTMYDEVLRVPLVIRFPDRRWAGLRVGATAGHIDVAPTLLAAAGVDTTNPRYRPAGVDLATLIVSDGDAPREMRSEKTLYGSEVKQLAIGARKVIVRAADGVRERYDVRDDPGETTDRSPTDALAFEPLDRRLDEWLDNVAPEPDEAAPQDTATRSIEDDDQLRRQLEALGYVQ